LSKAAHFEISKTLSDGNFYKTRFVGIGLICPNIQFGGLMFKNKKIFTLCKNGGSFVAVQTPNHFNGNFHKIRFLGIRN